MILIIAHHHDAEAQWLCQILKEDYDMPVYLLMPEALGVDYSISLQLQNNGLHHATIFFNEPQLRLECNEVWYAINRLSYINPIVWQHANADEKAYATNEINSFFPAFIHSLKCPVSNKIYHGALYGDSSFAAQWAAHLYQHGLSVNPLATERTGKQFEKLNAIPVEQTWRFIYANNEIILPLIQDPIKNYAGLRESILSKGGDEMLEFIFLKGEDNRPELLQVSKTPSLSYYGKTFAEALLQQLKQINHDYTNGHTQRNTLTLAC
ncbi:hypothetical protein [Mucilaginibacter sp. SP1R1]|uniref:hypothetical protein n=1 Tax=Mucilaginibacter sp. SP1R1 TaxID=2723091 RepID=UPI00160A0A41|nr:hypothetical protein [Mucilaginibacter sp. SP1R1]MBB6149361.1 hypothetical protein [Mucilaginibacter sp. SP1R1]